MFIAKPSKAAGAVMPEKPFNFQLRFAPYPYKAMLAICSDLDNTYDFHTYWEIARFLNTTQMTSMGPGAGLETGNSIYFCMPPGHFSYWNADNAAKSKIRALIHSGHIDCLHSFGDLAANRDDAAKCLDELARYDCKLGVWVDHGTSVMNFGRDIMQGCGDVPGHSAYHSDLTTDYGVSYVWRGRVTSIWGQNVRPNLHGICTRRHLAASAVTFFKETAKQMVSRLGSDKYGIHADNTVLCPAILRDGRGVYEFLRSNPHWGGVSCGEKGEDIGEVLTKEAIDLLIRRHGMSILYTHLGKVHNRQMPFNVEARNTFHRLAVAQRQKQILVTTTRRLLGFSRAIREISFTVNRNQHAITIEIDSLKGGLARADLYGLTFYTPLPEITHLTLEGREIGGVLRNGPDETGQRSVSLPWPRLEFPSV